MKNDGILVGTYWGFSFDIFVLEPRCWSLKIQTPFLDFYLLVNYDGEAKSKFKLFPWSHPNYSNFHSLYREHWGWLKQAWWY